MSGVDVLSEPDLPEKFQTIYEHQAQAVLEVAEAFKEGAQLVFLDAPTGSGKSLIGELVRRQLKAKALYVCSSKGLQDQFVDDFTYGEVIKGRQNYIPMYAYEGVTCGDCTGADCAWCEEPRGASCPYIRQRTKALRSNLAVANYSYLLHEANGPAKFTGRDLVIADECDELESELMGFVDFYLGARMLARLGVTAPKKGVHYETIGKWLVDELVPACARRMRRLDERVLEEAREINRLAQLAEDAQWVAKEVGEQWVRDNDAGPLVLKPVLVSPYGNRFLWRHGKKWLCMSASIISSQALAEDLGWPLEHQTVEVPMTFPVANRPVYLTPVADMSRNKWEIENLARALKAICDRYPNERILVHTVSYRLATELLARLDVQRPVLSYASSEGRDDAFRKYSASNSAVLLAPSMDRGYDFVGDLARVVVIAKVPFPNLGDKQISAKMRLHGGQNWYKVQTVRTIVQMTGRGVRGIEDWAHSFILDNQFMRIWKESRWLFPKWWKEAVNTEFPIRDLIRETGK